MKLAELVAVSREITGTTKRSRKSELLAAFLARLEPAEIKIAVSYLSGLTPQGRIGIGYSLLQNASALPVETASLEILDVNAALDEFTHASGKGAAQRRRDLLHTLFSRSTEAEQSFLFRLLTGELRQGALEGIMLDALARASHIPVERVRRAVMMAGEIAAVAHDLLANGEQALDRYDVKLFRPVQPMLAQTAEDVTQALEDLGEAALEYKFDGARVQVHRAGDEVKVYSRRLNDVTAAVPEIVEAVSHLPVQNLILDGEVLGLNEEGRPQPFQVTMRRFGRRLDVEQTRAHLPLTPVWFDLLYLDGSPLLDEPQARRFTILKAIAEPTSLVPHLMTNDSQLATAFVDQALAAGHEGVMAKSIAAPYAAGARGQSWLKIKQARTLDLVILAVEWGSGRRQGWLSNLHLGARDTVNGGFAMLGKTFKGLTDQTLAWQTQELLKLEVARDRRTVYVQPKLVAEIAFNEIQVSSRYPSGLALRFARVKRYRPDKSASEADTFLTVQTLAGH